MESMKKLFPNALFRVSKIVWVIFLFNAYNPAKAQCLAKFLLPSSSCTGISVEILFTGTAGPNAVFNWDFDSGTLISGNGQGPWVVQWATPGAKTISLEITENACSSFFNQTIVVNPTPSVSINHAFFNISMCKGDSIILVAFPNTYPRYLFLVNNTIVQDSEAFDFLYKPLENSSKVDSVGVICYNDYGCASKNSIPVSITVTQPVDVSILGPDTLFSCFAAGGSVQLKAKSPVNAADVTFLWSTGEVSRSINVNPPQTTTYSVVAKYKECFGKPAKVAIVVDTLPIPTIDGLPKQVSVCIGDSFLLSANTNAYFISWEDSKGNELGKGSELWVMPISDDIITVKAKNETCSAKAYTNVNVERCLQEISGIIPQIITPNGDGANDHWFIPDIDYFKENTVVIYNRWGQEVFSSAPYSNDWQGQSNTGSPLPEGTYFYVISLGIENGKQYSGNIRIRR
jgi:gliding motility-associated-like protein